MQFSRILHEMRSRSEFPNFISTLGSDSSEFPVAVIFSIFYTNKIDIYSKRAYGTNKRDK